MEDQVGAAAKSRETPTVSPENWMGLLRPRLSLPEPKLGRAQGLPRNSFRWEDQTVLAQALGRSRDPNAVQGGTVLPRALFWAQSWLWALH